MPSGHGDFATQRRVVDAFFAAARDGDLATLIGVLDPDAALRIDPGPGRAHLQVALRGAADVARQTVRGLRGLLASPAVDLHPVRVNGAPGVVASAGGRTLSVIGFTFAGDRIVEIDALADPPRVARATAGRAAASRAVAPPRADPG